MRVRTALSEATAGTQKSKENRAFWDVLPV